MNPIAPVKMKRCEQCGETYSENFFRKNRRHIYKSTEYRRPICKRCEQTNSDEKKHANPWMVKARTVAYTHWRRYKQKIEITFKEFCEIFRWDIAWIAHKMELVFQNGCDECHRPYKNMLRGMHDLTVDIVDPSKAPYWSNTRFICFSCNQSKGNKSLDEWEQENIDNRRWSKRQQQIKANPQLSLFGEGDS